MKQQSACNGPGRQWLAVALLAMAFAAVAWAQAPPPPADDAEKAQLRQEVEQLKKTLAAMEKRLDAMESAQAQPRAAAPAPPLPTPPIEAPKTAGPKPSMTVYGFAMLDMGQNFTQIDPDWFDTMRVSKLPSYENEYGEDNSTFAGVRQSRFGVKA